MPPRENKLSSGILDDSVVRAINSPEFQTKCQEIRERLSWEAQEEMLQASFVKRCWLEWRLERRIAAEIRKISPSEYAL